MIESWLFFALAAAALLGSPGPGIAALIAVGRSRGVVGSFRYFGAMQIGLAIAAGLTAAGLVAVILTFPILHAALTLLSLAYLLWLAWAIGSAPLSGNIGTDGPSNAFTAAGGFMLGFANPKAYLAFSSLFGSFAILLPAYGFADGLLKWGTCVLVMALVDFAWLVVGVGLGRVTIGPRTERAMNVAAACTILLACLAALR